MKHDLVSRRSLLAAGGAAGVALGVTAPAGPATAAPAQPPVVTPAEAWRRLQHGNHRFYTGHGRHPHQSLADLHRLAAGQHPFAITLGCADSRVAP